MAGGSAPEYREQYHWIEGVESLEKYRQGGYHPVVVGDLVNKRYRVVDKLGYGGYSTVWLARDIQKELYVALKIAISDSRLQETKILRNLSNTQPDTSSDLITLAGQNAIPRLLDEFTLRGPNGTHSCYTTAPAQCNLMDASFHHLFKLDVARALSVKLVSAIAYMHSLGYVHGVSRVDGELLSSNVPKEATLPLSLGKTAREMSLADTHLILTDFGEAFAPALDTRLCEDSRSPLAARPPEARFEPLSPLSFSADIWSLAIALWNLVGMKPLFSDELVTPETVVAQQVDVLGPMPQSWWQLWEQRNQFFDATGNSTQGEDASPPLSEAFDAWVQKYRSKHKVGVFQEREKMAFLELLRRMLSFDPRNRPTAIEVLKSDWVVKWAKEDFERSMEEA
ncbi:hypothetical protein K4F52_006090 [Lecanicillium sp. MT-2017a]|nr:hypothetical protein K4F52_006090 [Lecanicillium sp. MT-2017a]